MIKHHAVYSSSNKILIVKNFKQALAPLNLPRFTHLASSFNAIAQFLLIMIFSNNWVIWIFSGISGLAIYQ